MSASLPPFTETAACLQCDCLSELRVCCFCSANPTRNYIGRRPTNIRHGCFSRVSTKTAMRLASVILLVFRHEFHQRHTRLKLNPAYRHHRSLCGFASELLERQRSFRLRHNQAALCAADRAAFLPPGVSVAGVDTTDFLNYFGLVNAACRCAVCIQFVLESVGMRTAWCGFKS